VTYFEAEAYCNWLEGDYPQKLNTRKLRDGQEPIPTFTLMAIFGILRRVTIRMIIILQEEDTGLTRVLR